MLTYELKKAPGIPLYEALYRCLRSDILSGNLPAGEKLPSKRALAEHLRVSKITVETAYNQLLSEGYICSREKVGYFVEQTQRPAAVAVSLKKLEAEHYIRKTSLLDGRTNQIYITKKGIDIAEATKRLFDAIDEKMFASLTQEEFEALYRILEKIESNLQKTIKEEKNAL